MQHQPLARKPELSGRSRSDIALHGVHRNESTIPEPRLACADHYWAAHGVTRWLHGGCTRGQVVVNIGAWPEEMIAPTTLLLTSAAIKISLTKKAGMNHGRFGFSRVLWNSAVPAIYRNALSVGRYDEVGGDGYPNMIRSISMSQGRYSESARSSAIGEIDQRLKLQEDKSENLTLLVVT